MAAAIARAAKAAAQGDTRMHSPAEGQVLQVSNEDALAQKGPIELAIKTRKEEISSLKTFTGCTNMKAVENCSTLNLVALRAQGAEEGYFDESTKREAIVERTNKMRQMIDDASRVRMAGRGAVDGKWSPTSTLVINNVYYNNASAVCRWCV